MHVFVDLITGQWLDLAELVPDAFIEALVGPCPDEAEVGDWLEQSCGTFYRWLVGEELLLSAKSNTDPGKHTCCILWCFTSASLHQ